MTSSTERVRSRSILLAVACGFAILSCAWLLRPYTFMTTNHSVQIAFVQSARDPGLFPRDAYVDTFGTYSSLYWQGVARFRLIPLRATLGILYAITVIGGLIAAGLLGRALAPESSIAPWASAAAFGLGLRPFYGSGTIVATYPEQTSLAVVFFVLAFAAIAARRPWHAAIAYAVGFLLNQMYGVHVALYIIVFALLAAAKRRLDGRWVLAGLLAGVLITPAALLSRGTASAMHFPDAAFARRWAHALHYAGGGHTYLLDTSLEGYVIVAAVIVFVLAVARSDQNRWRRTLAVSAGVTAVLWLAVAAVLAYALPPSSALTLQAPRAGDLFCVFSLIYLIARLAERYERSPAHDAPNFLPLAGIVALFALYRLLPYTLAAIVLVALAIPVTLRRWLSADRRSRGILAVLGLILVATAWIVGLRGPRTVVVWRMGPSEEIREAASWATANTPQDALFMVSPEDNTDECSVFRPLSRRSLFVSFRDLGAIHWQPAYLPVFFERMAALGAVADADGDVLYGRDEIRERWKRLSDDQLMAVARKYAIEYVVFEAGRETGLPIAFRNDRYKIARFPVREP